MLTNMLCVVDMQYPFVQAEDACYVEEAVLAVRAARLRREHILVLEDRGGMSTTSAIAAELEGYDRVSYLRKGQWDGSLQIAIELSDTLRLIPARITACGAFAEECVMATLAGLRERFPGIELEVLRRACVPRPVSRFSLADWERLSRRYALILG